MTTSIDNTPEVEELVKLAALFHIKTGAPIEDIQQFIRDVTTISSKLAIRVMKEEVGKM